MRVRDSLQFLLVYLALFVWAKQKEDIEDLSHELKKSFETSPKRKEFIQLSRKFVMVNLEDDEEPEDDKFAPDGRYIPRLYFLKGGDPLLVENKAYPKNLYYFPQLQDVVKAMTDALKLYEEESVESTDAEGAKKVSTQTSKKDSVESNDEDKSKKESSKKDAKAKKDTDTKDKKDSVKSNDEDKSKKETSKKESSKKDAKAKKDTDIKDKKKVTAPEGECPHAKKAREAKEKKKNTENQSDSKTGKDSTKKKETKSQGKKSEL